MDQPHNSMKQLRPHLSKDQRMPRYVKEVEKIIRFVKSCQKNYKTILANSRLRGSIHKKVYSVTVNVLKNYNYIQKIIDKIQLMEKEKYLRREIASILIYEMLFGSGSLPGESKAIKTIQLYEKDILYVHEVLQNKFEDTLNIEINIPRYVRVHTLVTTVPYVIKDLISSGFHQIPYEDDLSEEKYLELVKNLQRGFFLIDFHFKDVLVFQQHEKLLFLDLYKNGHIFLQDKSSYIPVHVLNPQPGSAVIDACAAPGMKTLHIGAKMKNKGILIACERDKERFECLKKMLESGSVKICKTLCKDFKLIDPYDQAYSTVEYILLDPSCSGSGMVSRMDEVTDTENSKNAERLMKLAGFQIILLKHCLTFPAVERVVYSTCSIHEEENEYVVHEALKAFDGVFKLVPALPEWSDRGLEKFQFGKMCLRTIPQKHLTNGFFVAVFERIKHDECIEDFSNDNYQINDDYRSKKQMKISLKPKKKDEKKVTETSESFSLCDASVLSSKHNERISCPQESPEAADSKNDMLVVDKDEEFNISSQNTKHQSEENSEYIEHKNKKYKKKKKEKSNMDSCDSNRLSLKTADEIQLHLDPSFSRTDCANVNTNKFEPEKSPNKINLTENIDIVEDFVTLAHKKKKKKKKDHCESISLLSEEKYPLTSDDLKQNQPNAFSEQKCKIPKVKKKSDIPQFQLESDSNVELISPDIQNEHLKTSNCEKIEEPLITTFLHKKKKKHSDSHYNSSSCVVNSEHQITNNNIAQNDEVFEGLVNSTTLHKKKKKKKKHSDSDYPESSDAQVLQAEICLNKCDKFRTVPTTLSDLQHISSKLKDNYNSYPSAINIININNNHQIINNKIEINETFEGSTDITSSHKKKKKKKKKHLDSDYPESFDAQILQEETSLNESGDISLKENSNSSFCVINDNKYQNADDKTHNETYEEFSDTTYLHKKKKKKKKHLDSDYPEPC